MITLLSIYLRTAGFVRGAGLARQHVLTPDARLATKHGDTCQLDLDLRTQYQCFFSYKARELKTKLQEAKALESERQQ